MCPSVSVFFYSLFLCLFHFFLRFELVSFFVCKLILFFEKLFWYEYRKLFRLCYSIRYLSIVNSFDSNSFNIQSRNPLHFYSNVICVLFAFLYIFFYFTNQNRHQLFRFIFIATGFMRTTYLTVQLFFVSTAVLIIILGNMISHEKTQLNIECPFTRILNGYVYIYIHK